MSRINYRANLNAQSFPFISEFQGQSVIVKGADQNYLQTATIQQSNDLDKDLGIPQVYYCHNVMPAAQGMQSIGYNTLVNSYNTTPEFKDVFLLRDVSENKAYLAHGTLGNNYILLPGSNNWTKINIVGGAGISVTTAFVSGETYIYFSGVGCYKYVFASNTLVSVTLAGLVASAILGVTSANGYLIVWSATTIAWSSTIDPTDFVPSLATGAGGGAVEAARGQITCCLPVILGFIVYTTDNAVASIYSGNARYPYNFREIVGSSGVSSPDLVSFDGNTNSQYAYTTSGLELVSSQGATLVFPELTDFISGKQFEDFDETTNLFVETIVNTVFAKKLTLVSDRYLVLSYGITSLTHAIIFDSVFKRFGKLKLAHVDCFEFKLLSVATTETPRQSLAFLQIDGTVKQVDFSTSSANSSGVLILGKYQYVRTRVLQLNEVYLENVKSSNTFSITALVSQDGKYTGVTKLLTQILPNAASLVRRYGAQVVGRNISLLFKGNFYLVSIELFFNVHGRR